MSLEWDTNAVATTDATYSWNQASPYSTDINNPVFPVFTAEGTNGAQTFNAADITYTSSNPDVLTVAADGSMTALMPGTATVTASFAGNSFFNKFDAPIDITLTGKLTCAGVTVSPAPDAQDFFVDDKITFSCETPGTTLMLSENDGPFLNAGTMPASVTFTSLGAHKLRYYAARDQFNNGPEATTTYNVIPHRAADLTFAINGTEVTADAVTVDYNTDLQLSARFVKEIKATSHYTTDAMDDITETVVGDNGIIKLTHDCVMTVTGIGEGSTTEPVVKTFTIKRPAAPTYARDIVADVEQGDYIAINVAAPATKIRYVIKGQEPVTVDGTTANVQLTAPVGTQVEMKAWAQLPNGYEHNAAGEEAVYTVIAPARAAAPAASVAAGSAVADQSVVTFTSANANRIFVAPYTITGHLGEYVATEGNSANVTVSSSARRFSVYAERDVYGDNNGKSTPVDVMYDLVSPYRKVTDVSQLKAGMQFVVAVNERYTNTYNKTTDYKLVMSTVNSASSEYRRMGVDATFENDQITSSDPKFLVLQLEPSELAGEWYLKSCLPDFPGYLSQSPNDANEMYITPLTDDKGTRVAGTSVNITIDATGGASLDFEKGSTSASKRRTLRYSTGVSAFAPYKATSGDYLLPSIYALEAATTNYEVAFSQAADPAADGVQAAPARTVSVNGTLREDGYIIYETRDLKNVGGEINITIDGVKMAGHKSQALTETDYNSNCVLAGTNCTGEHTPHVFAYNKGYFDLVPAGHPDAVLLSTNGDPNHWTESQVHAEPLMLVALKPFEHAMFHINSNVDTITSVGNVTTDADAAVEYFNLQGIRVLNPANGIFIRRQGATVTKVAL